MGNSKKPEGTSKKGKRKKNSPDELGGISAAYGVDTRLAAAAAPSRAQDGQEQKYDDNEHRSHDTSSNRLWSRADSLIPGTNLGSIVTIVWFSYLHVNVVYISGQI